MIEYKTLIRKLDGKYVEPQFVGEKGGYMLECEKPLLVTSDIDIDYFANQLKPIVDLSLYELIPVVVIRKDQMPTPAELQAVITLITLNETECVYAHPLLKSAKEKLKTIL